MPKISRCRKNPVILGEIQSVTIEMAEMSNSEGWDLHSQNGVRLNKICCLHSLKLWHLKSDLVESNCSIFTEVNRDNITIQIHMNACGLAEGQPLPGFIKTKHILSSTVAATVVRIDIIIIREDMGVITALRLSKQNRAVKDMATAIAVTHAWPIVPPPESPK